MRHLISYLMVAVFASGGTYYFVTRSDAISGSQDEINRWRSRAYEAERQIAELRAKPSPAMGNGRNAKVIKKEKNNEQQAHNNDTNDTNEKFLSGRLPGATTTDNNTANQQHAPKDDEQWDMLVSGALEEGMERMGVTLEPEKRLRLLSALSKMRDSSLLLQDTQHSESDPGYLRDKLQRTVTLIEVDRLFRAELGVGVSQFIETLDDDEIIEIDLEENISQQ